MNLTELIVPNNFARVGCEWFLIETTLEGHFDTVPVFQASNSDGEAFEFCLNDVEEIEVM